MSRYCNNCVYAFGTRHTCSNRASEYYALTMKQIEEQRGKRRGFCVLFKKKRKW